eukprot:1191101-Prorocentrum_minimum.AAC.2
MSRAHRIGQKQRLMVYRLFTRGSVEERMLQVPRPIGRARQPRIDPTGGVPLIAAVFYSRVPILAASEPTTVAAYPGLSVPLKAGALSSRL